MGTSIFFLLFLLSLFSFHFLSIAASFHFHKNGLTLSSDDDNDWEFVMNPNTFSSRIWIGNNCKFDEFGQRHKCRTVDCDGGNGGGNFLQSRAYVDRGGGSLFRWRAYADDIFKYVSNKLNNNVGSSNSLVKLLLFVLVL